MKPWAQPSLIKSEAERQTAAILFKLVAVTSIGLLIGVLIAIYYRDVAAITTLSAGIVILIIPYLLLKRRQISAASITLTLLVILILTASATSGQGINDIAIVAFPIIYFFASVSMNRASFMLGFGFTLLAVFWLVLAELNGWFVPQPILPTSWIQFFMVANVLAVAAYASNLLGTTQRKNLARAEQEISERKLVEEALRDSEEKYRLIVENANDGIEITQDDKILFSNARFAEMLGYTTDEIMNKKFSTFFTEQATQSLYEREKQRKAGISVPSNYETTFQKKDGTIIDVNVKYEITEYKEKPATFAIISDITERKRAVEALAQSDSLREMLLDIITHDLRNPAGSIHALSDAAKQELPDNKFLDAIHTSSGHLINVLNQTTLLSQAAFGETIPKETLSLTTMISDSVDGFATALRATKMEVEISPAPDVSVEANPLLAEVFKNYISNAIKYARDGKRIVIETILENESILVCVKDFGNTIAKADRDRIFERRAQLEETDKRGRGLGLAIVKKIALAHDGEVWVEPNTPEGNCFCLRIPHKK